MALIISMLLSFLPARFRRGIEPRVNTDAVRGAFWSGILQAVACAMIWVFRLLWFIQYRTGTLAQGLIEKGRPEAMGSEHVAFGAGLITWMEYVLQPVSLLLLYFVIEGVVRYVAVTLHDEVVPSLPLQLIAWAGQWRERRRQEQWLGEKVPDEVLRGSGQDFEYRIASCRPKPWSASTTISYEDGLFEVFKEDQGEPPRRFIYLLKKAPAHKVVRGLHNYHPEEVMEK